MMILSSLKKCFHRFDIFCDQQIWLLIPLTVLVLLRVPNFSEPYWYGDEAIYLTIGHALNQGEILYKDIIDHKTPIIYYLARVPDQLGFRILNVSWMLITTIIFFKICQKWFNNQKIASVTTFIFVLLTSLPFLEGNIPNGELFVLGFVLFAFFLLSKTHFFQDAITETQSPQTLPKIKLTWQEGGLLVAAGSFFSLGILTKVPALLDVASFIAFFAILFLRQIFHQPKKWQSSLTFSLSRLALLAAGLLFPIFLSVLYFASKNALEQYFAYGLLYNIRYSQEWQLDFGNPWLNFAFTMPGKLLFLFIAVLLLLFPGKKLPKHFQLLSLWFIFTLFSVLLSSRPYPHYFIQMVPALTLLLVEMAKLIWQQGRKLFGKYQGANHWSAVFTGSALIALMISILLLFDFHPYPTWSYYRKFAQLVSGRISREQYENSFDHLVADNRRATALIQTTGIKKMFIWGTDPTLYAQSKTSPTSRFTVSFHIKDFSDYDRTFAQIEAEQPELIIWMKDETTPFPALENYLKKYYLANNDLSSMILFQRKGQN